MYSGPRARRTTRSSRPTGSTRSGLPGRRPGGSLPQRSTPGGEKAREKKTECEEGKITLEEYREWLSRFINASDGTILPYFKQAGPPQGAVLPVFDAGFTVRPRHIDLESVFWRKPLYCHRKQHSFLLQAIERPHEGCPPEALRLLSYNQEGAPCAQRCPAAARLRFL